MTPLLSRRLLIALTLLTAGLVTAAAILMARTPASAASGATTNPAGEVIEPAAARAVTPRGGIGNAAAKLEARGDVTVAFIGGPITASESARAYPQLVTRWLSSQYPGVRIKLVNAGLVDGGSALGAARLERDVLHHRPDLLFVEFAVDDDATPATRHVERLVRKAWTADARTDIVFLYALAEKDLPELRGGRLPPGASAHERVAEHYGIPSIAMGPQVLRRLESGKVRWIELFGADARPTPLGHSAYADAVCAALRDLLRDNAAVAGATSAPAPRDHALPAPINANITLSPTTRPAKPLPPPPALTDAGGRGARQTWALPIFGVHWVGQPQFKDAGGRVVWRLLTQSAHTNGRRMMNDFGLDRSRWGPPMRWFEEFSYFTGPAGLYLAFGTSAGGAAATNSLAAREDDLPIVVFTAQQPGRHVVRAKAAGMVSWGLHRALAMNVVHFPAGQDKGRSIAYHRAQAGISDALNLVAEVELAAGDEIAFQLDTNAVGGGGGAAFRDVEIAVGWFGD